MLYLSDIAVAVLAGPPLAAGAAKMSTPAGKLAWPIGRGPLRAPLGPRLVGGAEAAVATAVVLAPGRWAAAVVFVAYAVLTAVAVGLRGRRCACFGAARPAAVGNVHAGLNASGAVAGLALLVTTSPGWAPVPRAVAVVPAALATYGLVLAADRLDARRAPAKEAACDEQVAGVRLYVSSSCPACMALQELLATIEPARRDAITTFVVGADSPPPPEVADLGVPSAVPVAADDRPVCRPVAGIGPVKALIDGVTIRVPAAGRAG